MKLVKNSIFGDLDTKYLKIVDAIYTKKDSSVLNGAAAQ